MKLKSKRRDHDVVEGLEGQIERVSYSCKARAPDQFHTQGLLA